jgi:hypothetical protein
MKAHIRNLLLMPVLVGGLGSMMLAGQVTAQTIVSAGTNTIPGTYTFDFDAGLIIQVGGEDIFWEQFTSTTRAVEPSSSATL